MVECSAYSVDETQYRYALFSLTYNIKSPFSSIMKKPDGKLTVMKEIMFNKDQYIYIYI